MKILVIGSEGKMGRITCKILEKSFPNFALIPVTKKDNLERVILDSKPDIAIDFTSHLSVLENTWTLVKSRVRPIIGTSGLTKNDIDEISKFCEKHKLGGLIIPNFSLGFAAISKIFCYIQNFESSIVEFHGIHKKDKPSGTARFTADLLNITDISSIRSEGFIAKQQIYSSLDGERIVLDHEVFDREKSFSKGIEIAISKISSLSKMYVGLHEVLEL